MGLYINCCNDFRTHFAGNIDRHGSRLFILLTHNSAGGLPLGIMITSCEQQSVIEKGLNLLTEVMPPDCFNGRGAAGPNIFITDDCTAERTALRNVYPSSTLLLCIFHVLQAAWRWLWDSKHGIPKGSRQPLFQNIKRIMYASTPEEAATIHSDASEDPLTLRYYSLTSNIGLIIIHGNNRNKIYVSRSDLIVFQ